MYRVFGLVRKHSSSDHFYTSVYHNTHATGYQRSQPVYKHTFSIIIFRLTS